MNQELNTDEMPTLELPDLQVNTNEADEPKGGSISLNYTKIEFKNVGMGTVNY